MRADQITISVVALGFENDKDTSWLRELAGRGRGRFHRAEDSRQLPGLFRLEADEAGLTRRNALPFFVVPTEEGRTLFREVDWEQAPPLLDQNPAGARPGAEVWLDGRDGLPLLAYWRQGRGQTSSFATSWRGAWSVEWDRWPGAAQFRGALLRWLAPFSDEGTWEVLMQDWSQRELVISLRWLDQAKVPPPQPPLVALTSIDSKSVPLDWNLLGPGSWQARIPLPDTPVVLEGMAGAREQIPLTVWNPSQLPPPEFAIQLQPADWRNPIVLRPWILAALVVGLALFGPFGYRN
jgi:hypothetical protein